MVDCCIGPTGVVSIEVQGSRGNESCDWLSCAIIPLRRQERGRLRVDHSGRGLATQRARYALARLASPPPRCPRIASLRACRPLPPPSTNRVGDRLRKKRRLPKTPILCLGLPERTLPRWKLSKSCHALQSLRGRPGARMRRGLRMKMGTLKKSSLACSGRKIAARLRLT